MKTLLRSSLFALMLLGIAAGFLCGKTTGKGKTMVAGILNLPCPQPQMPTRPPGN